MTAKARIVCGLIVLLGTLGLFSGNLQAQNNPVYFPYVTNNTQTSTELPANSIDLAFICDTYHHFEFPFKTMASIHKALKPGGQVVLIDFHRIKGQSSDWVMGHVRAGQEVFTKEIEDSGFKSVEEKKFMKESYFLRFQKK